MNNTEDFEIAMFPIPNMVTFPKATVPLHVFEPRYRKLIQDCMEQNRRIGVCHIVQTLHKAEKKTTLEDKLKSNQDTYEPQAIFSAGFCELKETTEDGRYMVEVYMDGRYELQERIQEVPYQLYRCRAYQDQGGDETAAKVKREAIDRFLMKFADQKDSEKIKEMIEAESWQDLSMQDYSFHLFNMLHFDAEISQTILEMRSSTERLEFACKILNID